MTQRYRPGSRVQAVWEAFEAGGEALAYKVGRDLKLAESTLKSWMKMFAKPAEEKKAKSPKVGGEPAVAVAKTPRAASESSLPFARGAKVKYKNGIRFIGTILIPGPGQSEVRWDTGDGHTITQYEPNGQLQLLKADAEEGNSSIPQNKPAHQEFDFDVKLDPKNLVVRRVPKKPQPQPKVKAKGKKMSKRG